MKAIVDQEECIGCGACAGTCPEVFRLGENGKSEVYGEILPKYEDAVKTAVDGCPVGAISIA
jgi:ferredoxin